MNLLELIQLKKSGRNIPAKDMQALVEAVCDGSAPEYQLAALLTVICYEGLSVEETVDMTHAFVDSGESLDWSDISRPVVDKHSTGGVGDKVTLILAPMMACAGLAMPKMSGRGLGHTGGTIDKLESIPGFRTDLEPQEITEILSEVGCVVSGQTGRLVPADRTFYAMRDATDTVRETGLIAASVISKKLAAGASSIVLDVKTGNGAFFRTEAEARTFADLAVKIGKGVGRKISCVMTDMDQPLGNAVGNCLEVMEVLETLSGERENADLRAVGTGPWLSAPRIEWQVRQH